MGTNNHFQAVALQEVCCHVWSEGQAHPTFGGAPPKSVLTMAKMNFVSHQGFEDKE